jgi:hypothetical protein
MSWKTMLLGLVATTAVAVGVVAGASAAGSAEPRRHVRSSPDLHPGRWARHNCNRPTARRRTAGDLRCAAAR